VAQCAEHFSWAEILRQAPAISMENETKRREQEVKNSQKKREKKLADKAANKKLVEEHQQLVRENAQNALALEERMKKISIQKEEIKK
jgi:hypothetical protein